MSELSLHEAIHTTRAVRRLRPDPVPEEDLAYIVEAATQAPSGENRQPWAFVVVTDPAQRRRLGEIYAELGRKWIPEGGPSDGAPPGEAAVHRSARHLAEHLGEAPALVVACMRSAPPRDPVGAATYWGSIFPAVQNLMLAARARGLGTTLTTLHRAAEPRVKQVLGIPDEVQTVALIPVGYPRGGFGAPRRRPAEEVTHRDRWQGEPRGAGGG